MHKQIGLILTSLAIISAKIIPNDYSPINKNYDIQRGVEPEDWPFSQTFSNYDLEDKYAGDDFNGFGMKTANKFLIPEKIDPELDSPHILKVPVPQPYPVHIPVKQHFTVPIFKLVPEEVERKIPIPVEKLVPVYKEKPIKIIVEKHHPVAVYKPYAVPVPVNTHIYVGKKNEQHKWH